MDISNEEQDRIARKDLEKMEYDIIAEATASAHEYDKYGDEGAAVGAAESAAEAAEILSKTEELD